MSLSLALHLLAATIWVGGMFFAYQILRPVAGEMLEPPQVILNTARFVRIHFNH